MSDTIKKGDRVRRKSDPVWYGMTYTVDRVFDGNGHRWADLLPNASPMVMCGVRLTDLELDDDPNTEPDPCGMCGTRTVAPGDDVCRRCGS